MSRKYMCWRCMCVSHGCQMRQATASQLVSQCLASAEATGNIHLKLKCLAVIALTETRHRASSQAAEKESRTRKIFKQFYLAVFSLKFRFIFLQFASFCQCHVHSATLAISAMTTTDTHHWCVAEKIESSRWQHQPYVLANRCLSNVLTLYITFYIYISIYLLLRWYVFVYVMIVGSQFLPKYFLPENVPI